MDSTPSFMIPNINFSRADLKLGTKSWHLVQTEVFEAQQEYGCFEVDLKLHKRICGALEELFGLPSETKMKNTLFKPYIGNSDQNSRMLLYEGMGINDSQILEHLEEFTNIMWQKGNTNLWHGAMFPVHHVKMNRDGNDTRYSIVLFSYSKGIVQILEELVDEEHPLLYKPFDHTGLYHFSSTKNG